MLAEASATASISDPPTLLGGGTLLCLDLSQPSYEIRDYEKLCATIEAFSCTLP